MSYIDDIFERADIQQICSFLMTGAVSKTVTGSHHTRLNTASTALLDELHSAVGNEKQYERLEALATEAMSVSGYVFLEIGIKVGIKLAGQCASNQ